VVLTRGEFLVVFPERNRVNTIVAAYGVLSDLSLLALAAVHECGNASKFDLSEVLPGTDILALSEPGSLKIKVRLVLVSIMSMRRFLSCRPR
jgi:hypothetical protein